MGIAFLTTAMATKTATPNDEQPTFFSSGVQKVSMVELYTSEGCSSCPPADRWFSELKSDPGLWRNFVPVAFHVDYWDYIGWRDRYARAEFGDRQRRYEREGGVNTVYTPGVLFAGREWRDWRREEPIASNGDLVGNLVVQLVGDQVDASFRAIDNTSERLTFHVAILGMGLESSVNAGENHGELLRHDFTVLGYTSADASQYDSRFAKRFALPPVVEKAREYAIAAWVSTSDRIAPIQSTGGILDHSQWPIRTTSERTGD